MTDLGELLLAAATSPSERVRRLGVRLSADVEALENAVRIARERAEDDAAVFDEVERLKAALGKAMDRRRANRRSAECGTDSGYYKHRRNGQDACAPCKEAHRFASRVREQMRRAS